LDEPAWVYLWDHDAGSSMATRHRVLPDLVDQDVLVVCGHYPEGGIGRVIRRDGRNVWAGVGVEAA
jgi:hypothetical protein